MNTIWRITGGSILDFAAPVLRPDGGTMYASLGTGSVCLEREIEGKSYLTIAFGCTGGQHRSVMIAEDVGKHLRRAGYRVKIVHRDSPK